MTKVSKELLRERKFLERKIKALIAEYGVKVTYDFSRYIYVGVKENCNIALEDAINLITTCAGYEAHKLVTYKQAFVTNLYVRFADQNYAAAAAERLRQQEGYCVDMVRAMLVSWYLEEMLKGNFPWTLALVSIEGRAEHTNPLSQDVLQGMLMQFGDPRINTYQIGNQVEHVQVLFSSMSEALGASIAHGRWFRGNIKENPRFYYNIKIMSSEKESILLKSIQPNKPEADQEPEALEMDYFVQKIEVKMPSYMEESLYPSNSPTNSQDFRNSPRVREFRRQFSRGRGNSGRGKSGNSQWSYENRSTPRRFQNYASQITLQDFTNF
ncbi:uncharacterized protein LOC129966035 [Argiope bruennichi]|uniref:Uncharacterized protein n=1 Tax=Argiope bruennichi TaxID=94029 RepID=A0A8T0E6T0_ARGBR|nr:uncharacterized protein LOC129966035 [Argiope bruennichi]KAF8766976.1 hypothetical protein HNY73_019990 [Argiope bruennichi]